MQVARRNRLFTNAKALASRLVHNPGNQKVVSTNDGGSTMHFHSMPPQLSHEKSYLPEVEMQGTNKQQQQHRMTLFKSRSKRFTSSVLSILPSRSSIPQKYRAQAYIFLALVLVSITFLVPISLAGIPHYEEAVDVPSFDDDIVVQGYKDPPAVLLATRLALGGQVQHHESRNAPVNLAPSDLAFRLMYEQHTGLNEVPPSPLPPSHPDARFLAAIRRYTRIYPRWPKQSNLDVSKLRSYGPAFSSIIVSHKLKVVYVPVFNAGVASMMWCIAYLEGNEDVLRLNDTPSEMRDRAVLHNTMAPAWRNNIIWDKNESQIQAVFDDPAYLKFGFVRNPYHRALGAFIGEIVNMAIDSTEYQNQMYSLYGNDPVIRAVLNETRPSLKEFLRAVQNVLLDARAQPPDNYENHVTSRNLHWRPQTELLHPDLIHLDFVGRLEQPEPDVNIVLRWMHRHTNRRVDPSWLEQFRSTHGSQKEPLLRQLREDEELRGLVQTIYNVDFNTFQYSKDVPARL